MDAVAQILSKPIEYYGDMIITLIFILVAFRFLCDLFTWTIGKFGIETKRTREKKSEHQLLITTAKNLEILQGNCKEDKEQSIKHDKNITKDLDKVCDKIDRISSRIDDLDSKMSNRIVDLEISNMRKEILEMASGLSTTRKYSEEHFKHIFSVHEDYMKILQETGRTNGQVTASMKVIEEVYQEKLKNGF